MLRKAVNGIGNYPMKKKQATFKVATLQRCGTFAILQCSFSGGSEQYESFGGVQGAIFKGQLCWVLTAVSRATPYTPSESPRHLCSRIAESVIVGYTL